jgi:hypothetical protein
MAGFPPDEENNAVARKIDHKDGVVLELIDYRYR